MRTKKYDGGVLRSVLTGMVTDDVVCSRITSQWASLGLFDAKWANMIGGWCVDYCRRHAKSPGKDIRDLFEAWASSGTAEESVTTAVEGFLQTLSDDYEVHSAEHILDLAGNYFRKVQLKEVVEAAQLELERGFVDEAEKRLDSRRRVQLGAGSYVEPAKDYSVWSSAFEREARKPLVSYPGAVGEYFGDAFCRGELYSFMGPDKTGKTSYLLDFAYRAARGRNRVAFFDTGDSDQDEIMIRLASRTTRCPEYAMECCVPVSWDTDELVVDKKFLPPVDPGKGFKMFQKITKSEESFRLSCHPNSTLTVQALSATLSDWEREGWVPDVIVIDYADILAPPPGISDPLEAIDSNWKLMRRLSMEKHALVITATQSNAAAYGKEKGLLSRANFSGRKTKLAHVNGMIGINVSDDERQSHLSRLNWVVRRKMRNRGRQAFVRVAGCFDLEAPIILSKW